MSAQPENNRISFTFQEIAEQLVKAKGLHEGHWGVSVTFGLAAQNVPANVDGNDTLVPAALIPVFNIGINEFDKPNGLTVDASKVNPKKATGKSKSKAKAKPKSKPKPKPKAPGKKKSK